MKRQQIAPKKVYAVDTGLTQAIGFAFSANSGKLLENLLFLALRRQTKEIFYVSSPSGYEVDFYLPESQRLIQVSQNLGHPAAREREFRVLWDVMRGLNLSQGLILAETNAAPVVENGLTIEIRSLVEWLLEQESVMG